MTRQVLTWLSPIKAGGSRQSLAGQIWAVGKHLNVVGLCWGLIFSVTALLASPTQATETSTDEVGAGSEVASITPHGLIEGITTEVVGLISQYREAEAQLNDELDSAESEDARFKQFVHNVDATMMKAIDFDWIAYNVMGPYRKTATSTQKQEFARIFKDGLVETYGRGLLSYGDEEIVLISPEQDLTDKRRTTVVQEIRNAEGSYPLEYTMGLNKSGEWKVLNVVINGINLGKTFRNQFVQSAQQHEGDLDRVIADWDVGGSET